MTDNDIVCAMLRYSKTNILKVDGELISIGDILDLINRKNEEIERLEKGSLKEAMTFNSKTIANVSTEAVEEFAERFLKKVHDNHYMLSDQINSKDYGMFTTGIEQAVNETKEEMAGEQNV